MTELKYQADSNYGFVSTGDTYCTIRSLARLCGVEASSIKRHTSSGVAQTGIKTAEVPTAAGLHSVVLLHDEYVMGRIEYGVS